MKTKFILTAMCLPVAFAACTNEDLVVENQNSVEDRPVVDFKLAATYGADGADSRMVNNNGTFLWEGTDVLGAALTGDANNIYSNNKFVNELTEASASVEFTTQSTTVIGDYLFYYPYSTKMTGDLTGVRYSLLEPQVYDPTGEEMMKNNFMVAPRVLVDGNEPGELTLPITMRSIYGYGQLNLKLAEIIGVNNVQQNSSSVKVQKIILKYTSQIEKDGVIDVQKVPAVDIQAATLKGLREGTNTTYKGKTDAELRQILLAAADKELTAQGNNPLLDVTAEADALAADQEGVIEQVSITCVSEENPDGITLAKSGQFSTRVLLPTAEGANVDVEVYTNLGVFEYIITNLDILPSHKTVLANATSGIITMNEFTAEDKVNAISEADFIASMAQYEGMGEKSVEVTVGNFDLTAAAVAAIPEDVTLEFASNVTFNGNMTLSNMSFASGKTVTLKAGNITLGSDLNAAGATIKITGADVTLTKDNLRTANVQVAGGKLTISATNTSAEAVKATFASVSVTDNGTLNVNKGLNTVTVTKGTLNNAAGSTIASVTVATANGTVENNGTITSLTNAGTVNNYATIAGGSNSKNINQKAASSKLTLDTNSGTINTVAYSQTTVKSNNSGTVNFVLNARVSANGTVTYQAPADIVATSFAELPTAITKIVFTADFTYTYPSTQGATAANTGAKLPDNVTMLQFKGNLKVAKAWTLNENSEIYFSGASANINGGQEISNVAKIKAGVAETSTAAAVATDLYIATGTTVSGVKDVTLLGGATVWNDGAVNGTYDSSTNTAWGGNAINND